MSSDVKIRPMIHDLHAKRHVHLWLSSLISGVRWSTRLIMPTCRFMHDLLTATVAFDGVRCPLGSQPKSMTMALGVCLEHLVILAVRGVFILRTVWMQVGWSFRQHDCPKGETSIELNTLFEHHCTYWQHVYHTSSRHARLASVSHGSADEAAEVALTFWRL